MSSSPAYSDSLAVPTSPQHPSPGPTSPAALTYGLWQSPISAEQVARHATAYDAVYVSDQATYWLETRPSEGGRAVAVRWSPDGGAVDVVPAGFDVGSRVHEYGGGAYLPAGATLFACNQADQRLYRIDAGHDPVPITPDPPTPAGVRYADLRVTWSGRLLVCVRERHLDDGVAHELVALATDGSADPWVLASGHDFYAAPRPSPDGRRLAWTSWDQPRMPWDGTDLWVADLVADGRLGPARHVAGGPDESVVQPDWNSRGVLHFVSDRSGWWNLYRERNGRVESLLPMEAEFADAPWEFDYSSYAFVEDRCIACRYRQGGRDRLALLDPETGRLEDLLLPHTSLKPYLRATGDRLAFIGASPTTSPTVATLHLATGYLEVLAGTQVALDPAWISVPQPIEFPTQDGQTAHAFYYPPTNPGVTGRAGARPPLLVQPHPGPTADAKARLDLRTQFFTSRGFAVVEVNYGGSTGYGRAYRERLSGQWGVVDVADCLNAARHLVEAGKADGRGLVISGASAGGFTTLCALAFHRLFAAGTSAFGIADLETFRAQAPKFQAHELDRLIGPYPQAAATYRARSPMHNADRIACPVLLLQGLDDKVVPPVQAQAMAEALTRTGVRHTHLTFPGEGHGFRHPDTIRRALEAELSFSLDALGLAPSAAPRGQTMDPATGQH
jgi:dipeptidyl aminopeptidase/acylaminoacyl peptidase